VVPYNIAANRCHQILLSGGWRRTRSKGRASRVRLLAHAISHGFIAQFWRPQWTVQTHTS